MSDKSPIVNQPFLQSECQRRHLEDVQREVHEGKGEGVTCPCCLQFCKLYRRRFNSIMGYGLIWLCQTWWYGAGEWVHIGSAPRFVLQNGGAFAHLKHWNLIEEKTNEHTKKRCSGWWRPTTKGQHFVERKIRVPSHVFIYNNRIEGWSDSTTDIDQALGANFNYEEVMESFKEPKDESMAKDRV